MRAGSLVSGLALVAALGSTDADAHRIVWAGTVELELGTLPPIEGRGSGVPTVNAPGGHLSTIRIAGGIPIGPETVPVTDPEVTSQIQSLFVDATLGTGTLTGIAGALPGSPPGSLAGRELPVPGTVRVCLFIPGCSPALTLELTQSSGEKGVGIGGLLTVGNLGTIRISIEADPWTLGTGMLVGQTANGAFTTRTRTGFVHGPASLTSSTFRPSGVIQLIAPMQVTAQGLRNDTGKLQLFGTLTLHFIPEPGRLLTLGASAVVLALLGWRRARTGLRS